MKKDFFKKSEEALKNIEHPMEEKKTVKPKIKVKVGDVNAEGFKVEAVLEDGKKLLISTREQAKVILASEF